MKNPLKRIVRYCLLPFVHTRPYRALKVLVGRPNTEVIIPSLIARFCIGQGLEVGPGKHPYCNRSNTKFLDRFSDNKDGTINPDIVADAAQIPVRPASFDFLLSSHALEHHQNTLATLYEWIRVIRPGGVLFLVLPHHARTFDRFRKITTLQHHIDDYAHLGEESDYSHNDEIQAGWSKLPDFEEQRLQFEAEWGISVWDWEGRLKQGVIHFHVWSQNEIVDLFRYVGLKVEYVVDQVPERLDSFLVIGRKPDPSSN